MFARLPAALLRAGLVLIAFSAHAAAGPPSVVASIMPVQSLVASVGDGVFSPVLIVEGGGSPHTYALRPSQAQALQTADVVFWIGDRLETFLVRPLRALPAKARVVMLAGAPGVRLLPYRTGGGFEAHGDDHEHGHDHDGGHGDDHDADDDHAGGPDMHIWLDPRNAAAMAETIAATLAEVDPDNAARYRANAVTLRERLGTLEEKIGVELAPVRGRPFLVFHDAYQYFEARFGVRALGSVTLSPDRQPGVQRLAAIKAKITGVGAVCVFTEPQFTPALVATVTEGTKARTGVLDPLGASLTPGPDAYSELLEGLARGLAGCLAGPKAG